MPPSLTKPRKCDNWLKTLQVYVEDNESPRQFWLWSGVSAIAGALQRKVWTPFGLKSDTIYPCLYIMIVAPPGECRKAAPVTFAKAILQDIKVGVFVDSPTKRALTKYLAELASRQMFFIHKADGSRLPQVHCSVSLVSKELSSFLAVDAKAMIEILTELYDPHDVWEYKTSGEGADALKGVCTNCFFATTPSWLAANLPDEAVGGGFTSRFLIVSGSEKYKWISRPPAPDEALYNDLVTDLVRIRNLSGQFVWTSAAEQYYDEWYLGTEGLLASNRNPKLRGFISRMPTIAIKTAMCLRVAYSDELILDQPDLAAAVTLVTDVFKTAGEALGGQGLSRTAPMVNKLQTQLRMFSKESAVSFAELLRLNCSDTNKSELEEVLETLVAMDVVTVRFDPKPSYRWKGYAEGGGGAGGMRRGMYKGKGEEK